LLISVPLAAVNMAESICGGALATKKLTMPLLLLAVASLAAPSSSVTISVA
jgi:hypothetical protein